MKVKIVNKSTNPNPEYSTKGSACMDIRANITPNISKEFFRNADYDSVSNYVILFSGGSALIPTGIQVEIPEGYEIQVRPRSGLSLKHQIHIINSPGCIDSDYRGEIGVIVQNLGNEPFIIEHGDRIAQISLNKVEEIEWSNEELSETERGDGGFGHTGKN